MAKKAASSAKSAKSSPSTKSSARKAAPKGVAKAKPAKGTITTRPQPSTAPPSTATRVKFTLFNFLAQERAYFVVDRVERDLSDEDVPEKSVAHSIVVVDRSGSMYMDMNPLKQTLVKLLTIEEYKNYELLVTLISYSSQGDCTVHFERAPIAEIMKRDSKYLKEVEKLRVTGCTCISQGLKKAAELAKDTELTGITLHSDGYANDPSSTTEVKNLDKVCGELQGREVFVNTIAYSNSSDFRLLSRVANSVSGTCVKAGNIKGVYDALDSTSRLLGGSVSPPLEEPLGPDHDYQVFVSHGSGKLIGGAGPLKICGIKADDKTVFYKYRKLSKKEYDGLKDVPQQQGHEAVWAFSRANLAEGNLNTAKYALASTYDATLAEKHARALTNVEIAEMAQDLEAVLFQPGILQEHEVLDHVRVNRRISMLALARLLGENRADFTVNLSELRKNYRRRGLRRLQGHREDGKLIAPWLKTEYTDTSDHVHVSSFDVNRNTATLNMLIARPVRLVSVISSKPVTEVAGIKLDKLSTFNNYTVVSDGELNVPTLQVRISKKKLFDTLAAEDGVLELNGKAADKFDPKAEYTLRLDKLPVVPPFEGEVKLDGIFQNLAELKVLSSLLGAQLKEEAADLTPEQVEDLKNHYLSKNLYLNFPTTTEYTDLEQALNEGSVDSRVSYKVDIGSRDILNLGKLHSANKFLDRMYEVTLAGAKQDKPNCDMLLDGTAQVKHKQLSAKVKVTPVDDFMKKIFDDYLGLAKNGSVAAILKRVGDTGLAPVLEARHKGRPPAKQEYVEAMTEARKKLDAYADKLFEEKVSPLVFYIGATGLLPDEIEVKAQSAEALNPKYPNLTFSKDEQEGLYFEVGQTILGVYPKNEHFSTGAPVTSA